MDIQYITDAKGRKKGIFLSINDWNSVQKQLTLVQNKNALIDILQNKIALIEKRRTEILQNFNRSKKEKQKFSSDPKVLKSMLK